MVQIDKSMKEDENIQELKEKLKKGTISYFNLSKEQILCLEEILKEEIEKDKKDIEDIKEKIKAEKKKFQN